MSVREEDKEERGNDKYSYENKQTLASALSLSALAFASSATFWAFI